MAQNMSQVASNLKMLREHFGYGQNELAGKLGINRSAYANYELGIREFPYDVIEKLSSIYGCEPYSFFEDDFSIQKDVLACAFRMNDVKDNDFNEVCCFKNVVRSYLKMKRIANDKV